MAKILFLTPTDPRDRTFGGAMRSSDLRNALKTVAEVDTLVIRGGHKLNFDDRWSDLGIKYLTYRSKRTSLFSIHQHSVVRRWIKSVLIRERYDLVVARYLGQAIFVPSDQWSRLVIDADDVYKTIGRADTSWVAATRILLRNLVVARLLGRARHVWLVNANDQARLGLSRASWLGNTVLLPPALRVRPVPQPGRILMVGLFSHPPNLQGLMWFVAHVLPTLRTNFVDVELHVVGKCPDELAQKLKGEAMVHGFVNDIAAEYDRSVLVVAPVSFGAGSQIKVIDALAHARPLVVSTFAHSGFSQHLRDREHLLVAETTTEWVDRCATVLKNAAEAEAMGKRGYAVVAKTYGPNKMALEVRSTVRQLISSELVDEDQIT